MNLLNINHIDVNLWGKLLGKLAIDNKGTGYFKYSDEYLQSSVDPSPIHMPVKKGIVYSFPKLNSETYKGLPGLISDSLPDAYGDSLLDIYFNKEGIKGGVNIQLLKLCYINNKAIGALEFAPPIKLQNQHSNELHLSDLTEIVDKLISSKQKLTEGDLNKIAKVPFSAMIVYNNLFKIRLITTLKMEG